MMLKSVRNCSSDTQVKAPKHSGLALFFLPITGTVELFQYVDDPKRPPGDFENAGFLGIPNSASPSALRRLGDPIDDLEVVEI